MWSRPFEQIKFHQPRVRVPASALELAARRLDVESYYIQHTFCAKLLGISQNEQRWGTWWVKVCTWIITSLVWRGMKNVTEETMQSDSTLINYFIIRVTFAGYLWPGCSLDASNGDL